MPIFPCDIDLADCDCSPNPVRNLSSEAPDPVTFTGINFTRLIPPLGTAWSALSCVGLCQSTISQQDADQCAAIAGFECGISTWRAPGPGPQSPPVPPPENTRGSTAYTPVFNTPQTCGFTCPDGNVFNFTTPAGTFASFNLASANEMAFSYACNQAALRHVCLSDINPLAALSVPYSSSIVATGAFLAVPPQTDFWEIIFGAVPPGLTFHGGHFAGGSVLIDGTPTVPGVFVFLVRFTDAHGDQMVKAYSITVSGGIPLPPCCNCGGTASIANFNPALFTFHPADYALGTAGGQNFILNSPGVWDYTADNAPIGYNGFVLLGGHWYALFSDSGTIQISNTCGDNTPPPVFHGVTFYSNSVFNTVDQIAWNGFFPIINGGGNVCCNANFSCQQVNGLSIGTLEIDSVLNMNGFWDSTLKINGTDWIGVASSLPSQSVYGTYLKTGGIMTGPASITIQCGVNAQVASANGFTLGGPGDPGYDSFAIWDGVTQPASIVLDFMTATAKNWTFQAIYPDTAVSPGVLKINGVSQTFNHVGGSFIFGPTVIGTNNCTPLVIELDFNSANPADFFFMEWITPP